LSTFMGRDSVEFHQPDDSILLAAFGDRLDIGSVDFELTLATVSRSWVMKEQKPYELAIILEDSRRGKLGERLVIHMTEDFALRLCAAILGESPNP
jgi:hypothetical protein